MVCLSRTDIEKISNEIIAEYKAAYVPEKRLCYQVDAMELAQLLGLTVDFQSLSLDCSILGLTAPEEACITIFDDDGNEMMYCLDGSTILIEKKLLHPKAIGRMHFTMAHEMAHQVLYRKYPDNYGPQHRLICDYRRSEKPKRQVSDWFEWQADVLAAAILLPKDAILETMYLFGLGERMKVLSKRFSPNKYEAFCAMAEVMEVSRTALAYRMEQLGLLERNLLVQEARARKGVA